VLQHFKDLLQIRRNELLLKRGMAAKDETSVPITEVEINLSLSPKLCIRVAQALGSLLLKMDSTCHSDVYLIVCKALARIATSCRPSIPLGSIFNLDQMTSLILTAVGSDYVRQANWSSPWISHAVMCLVQDILEGKRQTTMGVM
jgi:baculoviral IAP repeat-containing protein 6